MNTDIIFEDIEEQHSDKHNINLVSKRSISDVNVPENDVQDILSDSGDDSHWIWGSVKRLKRSIDQMLQSDEDSHKHVKRMASNDKINAEKPKKKKKYHKQTMADRKKRQDIDDSEDYDEDDDDIIDGSGQDLETHDFEVSSKEERLC